MHTIQLEHVTFIRNNRKILNDISLEFPPGKTSVIIGPSGCGKSTILKVAAGLVPPTSGNVLIDGEKLRGQSRRKLHNFRMQSSFVFQDAALWANQSVYENINLSLQAHFPKMNKDEKDAIILSILKKVGYTDSINLRPAQLSNGEQKMVSLARALVTEPTLLYLDNPLILVDPSVLAKMKKLIINFHNGKETILANFSNISLTKRLADFAVVMKDGKVIYSADMKNVLQSKNPEAREILENILLVNHTKSV